MTAIRTGTQPALRNPWIAVVAALAFVAGVVATSLGGSLASSLPVQEQPAIAAPTFDAVRFRAEERAGSYPEPTFDPVTFRAEERTGSYPEPTFDWVRFRAEEAGR